MKLSNEEDNDAIIEEIKETEDKLSILTAEENKNKVIENFEALANTDGSCNINGIWKMKKKMFPKNKQAIPVAKKDMDSKILSSQEDINRIKAQLDFPDLMEYSTIIPVNMPNCANSSGFAVT